MNASAQQKLLNDLAQDRSVYPHQYDVVRDQLLLVRLDLEAQAQASFLDDRVLSPNTEGAWFTWDQIAPAGAALKDQHPRYIFHMGHCGSTLLSRLISAATSAVAMREPLPLRSFAFDAAEGESAMLTKAGFDERLAFFERCWGRGDAPVIVKATSICTGIAGRTHAGAAKSLFLYQTPQTHLTVLLAGANTLADLRGFARMRHRRLQCFFDAPALAETSSVGELAAQLWLCEASAAARLHDGDGFELLNFEKFLAAPAEELKRQCAFFDLPSDDAKIAAALSGPIMKSYSKAPEHGYTPEMRRAIIAESAKTYSADIKRGMAYLEKAGASGEAAARALELFSQ